MSRKGQGNRRKLNRKGRILAGALTAVLAVGIGVGITYAKYYDQGNRKGVSVASGLYFTSNCLSSIAEEDSAETPQSYETPEDCENFARYVSADGWGANAATVDIQINNFDNILLFNDKNLDITYDLNFMLLQAPDAGTKYQIQKNGENGGTWQLTTKGEIITLKDQLLPGGSARFNQVYLTITPPADYDKATYVSDEIAVWAVPTAPDYVAQSKRLGAVITVIPPKGLFRLQYGYKITEDLNDKDRVTDEAEITSWWTEQVGDPAIYNYQRVEDSNGFEYVLQTTGEDRDYTHYILMRWKKKYLEIDKQNALYLESTEKDAFNENIAGTPFNNLSPDDQEKAKAYQIPDKIKDGAISDHEGWTQITWYQDSGNDEWDSLLLEAPEYKAMTLTFYRTEQFHAGPAEAAGVTIGSTADFLDLIEVWDVKVPITN